MDWEAFRLSFALGAVTVAVLVPAATWLAHHLARSSARVRGPIEAIIALPLVLPPTVVGFYLLTLFGARSPLGDAFIRLTGQTLAFSFEGLVCASILVNLPFAVQPALRAFEAVPTPLREAAACCGLSRWATFRRIEMPLAWPGVLSAAVLTFAHTLGEFGVVLMVGGNIPSETRTLSVAIYDRMQALDDAGAGAMAALLLVVAFVTLGVTTTFGRTRGVRR